jgi:hypothetical protein
VTEREQVETLDAQLAEWRDRLAKAEQDAARAIEWRDAVRKIVEGQEQARALLLRASRGMQALPGLEETAGKAQPELEPAVAPPNGKVESPRGRDAVRRVMQERPHDVWRLTSLVGEITRRGWIDPEARDPASAIRVAARRLADTGEIEKVGTGRYRLVSGRSDAEE